MTLAEYWYSEHRHLFYSQTWWQGEPFAAHNGGGVTCAKLFAKYLEAPHSPIWRDYIWTDETDRHGNPIYCAGVGQDGCDGFSVHRLLVPDHRWRFWDAAQPSHTTDMIDTQANTNTRTDIREQAAPFSTRELVAICGALVFALLAIILTVAQYSSTGINP